MRTLPLLLLLILALCGCVAEPAPIRPTQFTVWAVDPTGSRPPEQLWTTDRALRAIGLSNDGRYLLMTRGWGAKGPSLFLYDFGTQSFKEGPSLSFPVMDPVTWSGRGFWIAPLVHADLDLQVQSNAALQKLVSAEGTRTIRDAHVVESGKFAAFTVAAKGSGALELVTGTTEGTELVRTPTPILPWNPPAGTLPTVRFALSPDGTTLAVSAKDPPAALINLTSPSPANWVQLPKPQTNGHPAWSPDGAHLFVPGIGIIDRHGQLMVPLPTEVSAVWSPDSASVAVAGASPAIVRLTGERQAIRAAGAAVGFLPDGRLIMTDGVISVQYEEQRKQ